MGSVRQNKIEGVIQEELSVYFQSYNSIRLHLIQSLTKGHPYPHNPTAVKIGQWYPGPQRPNLQVVPILGHHGSNIGKTYFHHQSL